MYYKRNCESVNKYETRSESSHFDYIHLHLCYFSEKTIGLIFLNMDLADKKLLKRASRRYIIEKSPHDNINIAL